MVKKVLPLFIFAVLYLCAVPHAYASVLHIAPSTIPVNINGNTQLNIMLDTKTDTVNAVSAVISYPSDKIDITDIRLGSAFPIPAEHMVNNGVIKISLGSFTPVQGNITIATIDVKAKMAGNATIYFTSDSHAPRATDSTDSLDLASSTGAVINISSSVIAPSSTPSDINEQNSDASKSSQQQQTLNSSEASNNSCTAKSAIVEGRMNDIYTLTSNLKNRLDIIDNLVEKFYTLILLPENKKIVNFNQFHEQIQVQKEIVTTNLNAIQNDINSFSCTGEVKPKDQIDRFKMDVQTLKDSLKNYQSDIKSLIEAIKTSLGVS